MNKSSNNNYSKRNSSKRNRGYKSNDFLKSTNKNDRKRLDTKKDIRQRASYKSQNLDSSSKQEVNKFDSKENKKSNFRFSERMKYNYKENEFSRAKNIKETDYLSNNKSFDDWIWGKHSVYASLNSERPINRIWCTAEIFSSEKFYLLLKGLKSKGVLVEEVTWSRLSQLTYGATHQGIALQLASSETISLVDLIQSAKNKTKKPVLVALDGITDPHNLGAIIRSAEAFDCKGIIIPQRRSVGLTGTVAKVAAGALEHIPVSRVINLNRALEELKKNGFTIVGLSGDSKVPISSFEENSPLVVIVGAENKGISLLTQKKCDYLLKIPLKGKTSSLNASVAAAISLYSLTIFKKNF